MSLFRFRRTFFHRIRPAKIMGPGAFLHRIVIFTSIRIYFIHSIERPLFAYFSWTERRSQTIQDCSIGANGMENCLDRFGQSSRSLSFQSNTANHLRVIVAASLGAM